jgi:hypothetical protein
MPQSAATNLSPTPAELRETAARARVMPALSLTTKRQSN